MLRDNSPTLQRMINAVKPGDGNMNTVPGNQGQCYQPYPTPKDMVMQAGMNMNPQGFMPGFNIPGNTIAMINGIPTELEYRPHESPMPGRYIGLNNDNGFGYTRTQMLNNQANIVGGYNPYAFNMQYPYSVAPQVQQQAVYGNVNIYNGNLVHPNVNQAWYGSPDYPFINQVSQNNNLSSIMRDRFNQMFPGYNNPYMAPGFMQAPVSQFISKEMQDMANLAAYYGMSYDEFVENNSKVMKALSKISCKAMGYSEEEIKKREKYYDKKKSPVMFEGIQTEDALFYPPGALDYNMQLTTEFKCSNCVSQDRKKKIKSLKVTVTIKGKDIECKRRAIDPITARNNVDRWIASDVRNKQIDEWNRYRFSNMYWNAPERKLDNIEGNVFQVTSKALAFAEQKDLERQLEMQKYTRSASTFNRDDYITQIKSIRDQHKAREKAIDDQKWRALIHTVAGQSPSTDVKAPSYQDRPYICDGDWIIAKPGVDIVGLPLDQSVNKIVRLNTATGEEEIYDPGRISGMDVRERILASIKPSFDNIDGDELADRLERFKHADFKDF